MKKFCLALALGFCALTANASAQYHQCGDFDGDSLSTVADMVAAIQYLFEGGAAPGDFDMADFDLCQKLTLRDQVFLINCVFACDFWNVQCPPINPPFTPNVNPDVKLIYPESVPINTAHFRIDLDLISPNGLQGLCFPMRLRINGMVPTIDSVTFVHNSPTPMFLKAYIDQPDGVVTLAALNFQNITSLYHLAKIFVSVTPSAIELPIAIEWANLTPAQAPPGQENSVFAYAADRNTLGEFVPTLTPNCCNTPGDADHSGFVSISDVLAYLCFIFEGCEDPQYCPDERDVDQNGIETISDAVFLLNYIFAGGPAPVCR